MEKIPENKIEIKPMGSYFEVDEDGYLINPASLDKVQNLYKTLIDEVVEINKSHYGEKLKHVFVRGSVAKGEAVEYVSDIDFIVYVDIPDNEIDNSWVDEVEAGLMKKYPFVCGMEFWASPISEIEEDYGLLIQSILVYGDEIKLPKMKPDKNMMRHLPFIETRMPWFDDKLKNIDSESEVKKGCEWFMKNTLRCGFELTMERSKRYTRDLYLCYKDFSEYYPEKEEIMREVLDLALNPISDKEKILEIKHKIAPFLLEEAKKVLN